MSFKILLVDDSRLVRTAVRDMIEQISGAEVVGEASNGQECLDFLKQTHPDLIIMDVEMPVLDGISTLKSIKKQGLQLNILMLSVLTNYGALTTFRALDLGAMDFLPKPSPDSGLTFQDIEGLIIQRVSDLMQYKSTSEVAVSHEQTFRQAPVAEQLEASQSTSIDVNGDSKPDVATGSTPTHPPLTSTLRLLVIGASTGGPPALQKIIEQLPADFPVPVLIVQHMPPIFTRAFAARLDTLTQLSIAEAAEGDALQPGHVLVAPGDFHLGLKPAGSSYAIHLDDGPPRHAHRPSIDYTLEQAMQAFGGAMAALIMTGMGTDGVSGMKELYSQGGLTLAQDEESSVVYGMNRRAVESGCIREIWPLDGLADRIKSIFCK